MTKSHPPPDAWSRANAAAWSALECAIGYTFTRRDLLELSLTHSSWAHERKKQQGGNERLEFLGDAVLQLCVSSELYRRFPEAREGELTRRRATLVNERTLAALAREIGLDALLKLGCGEEQQGGRQRDAALEDAMEALMAAIYEDGGFGAALEVVRRLFAELWKKSERAKRLSKNNKTLLHELSQRLFKAYPTYSRLPVSGPEHARIYAVEVTMPDGRRFRTRGGNCRKAEQEVAGMALAVLERD